MSDQAQATPLVDLLRGVPKDHRTQYESQWREDGSPTGHTLCPVGRLMHEAADEIERLKGVTPALPPRPPEGEGLPRYGIRWNGVDQPLSVPMDDGYWTPWHLAGARE
jgi:hypothetical protein